MTDVDFTKMTAEQENALRVYRQENGRLWKNRLRKEWQSATAPPLLMQLRNASWFGPAGLIYWAPGVQTVKSTCNGIMRNGPDKKWARCQKCGAVDYEKNEGDACRRNQP